LPLSVGGRWGEGRFVGLFCGMWSIGCSLVVCRSAHGGRSFSEGVCWASEVAVAAQGSFKKGPPRRWSAVCVQAAPPPSPRKGLSHAIRTWAPWEIPRKCTGASRRHLFFWSPGCRVPRAKKEERPCKSSGENFRLVWIGQCGRGGGRCWLRARCRCAALLVPC
jgi:hypothetical protein